MPAANPVPQPRDCHDAMPRTRALGLVRLAAQSQHQTTFSVFSDAASNHALQRLCGFSIGAETGSAPTIDTANGVAWTLIARGWNRTLLLSGRRTNGRGAVVVAPREKDC